MLVSRAAAWAAPAWGCRPELVARLVRAAAQGNRFKQLPGQPIRTGTNMVLVVVSFSVPQCRDAVKLVRELPAAEDAAGDFLWERHPEHVSAR